MALVSIITPLYNSEKYISETIESVLSQSFGDWEMIIVDDCSTDSSFQIAFGYTKKDKRIKLFKNETNLGVAATRNHGLRMATGKYIAFIDSDDLWAENKLERQIAFMSENKLAFSYSKYCTFNSDDKNKRKVVRVPKKMTANKILGNTAIACLTVMVNKEMVGDFYMPLIKHTEDNCTWQNILSRGFTAYGIQEVLSLYRVTSNSLTSNKKNAAKLQWKTYREYYHFSLVKTLFYFIKYSINAVLRRL